MIINQKRRWLLKIDKRSSECKDYFKNKLDNKFENGLPIFKTTEGLYVSFKNESINLRLNLNLGETVKHELILAESDGKAFSEMQYLDNVKRQICELSLLIINSLTIKDDSFHKIPTGNDNKSLIIYIKNKKAYIATCILVNNIIPIEMDKKCYKDIPIKYSKNNITGIGFLTESKIIRTDSKIIDCLHAYKEISFENEQEEIIYDKGKIRINKINNILNIGEVIQNSDFLNFPHFQGLIEENIIHDEIIFVDNKSYSTQEYENYNSELTINWSGLNINFKIYKIVVGFIIIIIGGILIFVIIKFPKCGMKIYRILYYCFATSFKLIRFIITFLINKICSKRTSVRGNENKKNSEKEIIENMELINTSKNNSDKNKSKETIDDGDINKLIYKKDELTNIITIESRV